MSIGIGIAIDLNCLMGRNGASGAFIALSANTLQEGAAEGTAIGTLSTVGTTGTASFTLVDSAGNKVKLAGTNNVNLQAGAVASDYETATSFDITVSVSGVTPAIANRTFTISVTDVSENELLADTGSPILADTGSPILVQ